MSNFCLRNDTIIDYIEEKLDIKTKIDIEEHFFKCDDCTEKARKVEEYIYMLKLIKKVNKSNIKNDLYFDGFLMAAASSSKCEASSTTSSIEGKYSLTLTPFINESTSLLEVKVNNSEITGTLVVENENGIVFSAPILNGYARDEVTNNIDLRNVIVYTKSK